MASEVIELKVSESISAGTDVVDTYTPANGTTVRLVSFIGEAAFSSNSVVCVLWDYAGGGEEIIWCTKGSSKDLHLDEACGTGDGTKKVAICCKNGEAGDLIMLGKAQIAVES